MSATVPAETGDPLHRQRPLPLANLEVTPTMPTRPRPALDPWGDADGTPIPQQCRIEQVDVGKNFGAPPSRLHRKSQVGPRPGYHRLIVQFEDNAVARIQPHLVRVFTAPDGC